MRKNIITITKTKLYTKEDPLVAYKAFAYLEDRLLPMFTMHHVMVNPDQNTFISPPRTKLPLQAVWSPEVSSSQWYKAESPHPDAKYRGWHAYLSEKHAIELAQRTAKVGFSTCVCVVGLAGTVHFMRDDFEDDMVAGEWMNPSSLWLTFVYSFELRKPIYVFKGEPPISGLPVNIESLLEG